MRPIFYCEYQIARWPSEFGSRLNRNSIASERSFLSEAIFAYMSSVATTNLKMHLSYC